MSLDPRDKETLIRYWHMVIDSQQQENLTALQQLGLIHTGLELTKQAYEHITCLNCGMPWALHPRLDGPEGELVCKTIPGTSRVLKDVVP